MHAAAEPAYEARTAAKYPPLLTPTWSNTTHIKNEPRSNNEHYTSIGKSLFYEHMCLLFCGLLMGNARQTLGYVYAYETLR